MDQIASRIGAALASIGITVTTKLLSSPQATNIIFNPQYNKDEMGGVDFNHGVFDVFFTTWREGIIPDEFNFYSSRAFAPLGDNYQFLNNTYMDHLMDIEDTSTNIILRLQAFQMEQQFVYTNVTISIISQPPLIYAINAIYIVNLNPFLGNAPLLNNVTRAAALLTTTNNQINPVTTVHTTIIGVTNNWFSSPELILLMFIGLGIILLIGIYADLGVFMLKLKLKLKKQNQLSSQSNIENRKKKKQGQQQGKEHLNNETLDVLQEIIDENE